MRRSAEGGVYKTPHHNIEGWDRGCPLFLGVGQKWVTGFSFRINKIDVL